jgi:hypothetical protein
MIGRQRAQGATIKHSIAIGRPSLLSRVEVDEKALRAAERESRRPLCVEVLCCSLLAAVHLQPDHTLAQAVAVTVFIRAVAQSDRGRRCRVHLLLMTILYHSRWSRNKTETSKIKDRRPCRRETKADGARGHKTLYCDIQQVWQVCFASSSYLC